MIFEEKTVREMTLNNKDKAKFFMKRVRMKYGLDKKPEVMAKELDADIRLVKDAIRLVEKGLAK